MLDHLERLLVEGTKGKWELGRLVKCDCGEDPKNCWHTFEEQVEIFPTADESGPVAVASSESRAALIVAAVNNLEALVKVVRAHRALLNALAADHVTMAASTCDDVLCDFALCVALRESRAALKKLEERG